MCKTSKRPYEANKHTKQKNRKKRKNKKKKSRKRKTLARPYAYTCYVRAYCLLCFSRKEAKREYSS